MNELVAAIGRWLSHLKVFVMVQPWEQCLRVRMGRSTCVLAAGPHWRIPLIDEIYRQSVRRRTSPLNLQTVSTHDGVTLTVGAALGYSIASIEKLYATLHHAEDTLAQMATAAIARCVYTATRVETTAEAVGRNVTAELAAAFADFGIAEVEVRITDFAFIRAFRLIQDQRFISRQSDGLSTVAESDAPSSQGD